MTDGGGATVLVVEDDPTISDLLSYNLERAGYSVLQEGTGRGALERSMDPHLAVDLILMDLMLPGLDGMAASREIRRRRPQLPIIMLTARAERETLLEGFAAGADDYITKPFDVDELLARIGARIKNRRDRKESSPATPSDAVEAGTVRLDPNTHKLRTALGEVTLSPKEHDLFALLASFPGHLFPRKEIVDGVWHHTYLPGSRTMAVHIRRLRARRSRHIPLQPRVDERGGRGGGIHHKRQDQRFRERRYPSCQLLDRRAPRAHHPAPA